MKWITRERPKIDRVACPWLIKRIVDKEAEFVCVPTAQVLSRAKKLDAIPHEMLRIGMVLYDALYSWATFVQEERHTWNPDLKV